MTELFTMVSMVLKECESLTSPEWNTYSSYEDNINAPENKNEMAFKKRHFNIYSKDSASWAGSAATSTDVGATGQGGVLTRRGGGNQDVIYGG